MPRCNCLHLALSLLGGVLLGLAMAGSAFAWPTDAEWRPLLKGGSPIQDSEADANGGVNVVPNDGSAPAAYIYNDGTYLYYRLRLDSDPTASGGAGTFQQFGWGFEIDADQNLDNYEWLIMCDGISSPEVVSLQQNTEQRTLGDPSDVSEVTIASWPMVGNHRVLLAGTCINDDSKAGCSSPDYFLDFRIPYAVFKTATGLTDSSIVTYFAGSSRSTNNLTDNGADLVGGSDLYTMASDLITPLGYLPPTTAYYNGTVRFVTDLGGFADLDLAGPGDTVYLRVDDLDLNDQTLPGDTLTVTVTAPTGDSERVTLTATGVQGKYTGSLVTSGTTGGAANNGTLYILNGQSATVTYVDVITASLLQRVNRSDTLLFTTTGTDVAISKSVDLPVPSEGQMVTFTVTATNNGPSAITALTVTDLLPANLTYVSHDASQGSYVSGSGAWTVGALARYATATLTLRATVKAGTSGSTIVNSASLASSTPADGFAGNNSASATLSVGGTDLEVTKGVSNPLPAAGDSISYTVRTTNLGPNPTDGVQVTDLLPAGVTYVSHSTSQGSYVSGSGLWSVGTLAVNGAALLTINATVNAGSSGQTITNTTSLTASTQPDSNSANNSASAPIRVGFIDLALTKTAQKITAPAGPAGSSVAANIGNTVEFVVTLTNHGPHSGTGLAVSDLLPSGLTFVSATPSQGSYVSGTGIWTIGTLASGASATLTLRATINTDTAGQTLVNSATVSARNQPEANPGDESASARVAVNGTDIGVTKTVSNATPAPGASTTWTVTVTNNGPNQGTGIQITDILPPGITRTSHTTSQGTWDTAGGNPSYVWNIGTLNVATSATLTIVTTVDAGTSGQVITNVAMITAEGQADPDETNNIASAAIAVSGTDLAIAKSVDVPYPDVGDNVTYTLTASNLGPNPATGVTVSDLLPPEVTYVSHNASTGSYVPATGLWSIGNLANGASTSLSIVATVRNEDSRLVVTNTAAIDAATADGNSANNTTSVDIVINGTNLAVAKTASSATPYVGVPFTFTVTISNTGAKQATGVQVEDLLPAGLTQSGATPSQGSFSAGLWLVGTLNGGASSTLTLTVTPNAGTAGTTITNTARLVALNQIDINAADDQASYSVVPQAAPPMPLLSFLKTTQVERDPVNGSTAPQAIPGAEVLYVLLVSNFGPGAVDGNTLILVDPIPAGTALYVSDLGQGSPVLFADPDGDSGLTPPQPFTLSYSNKSDCAVYTYTPVPDGTGFDANVCRLRAQMSGTLAGASGAVVPDFSLTFRIRLE